jgi:hypothetical protein
MPAITHEGLAMRTAASLLLALLLMSCADGVGSVEHGEPDASPDDVLDMAAQDMAPAPADLATTPDLDAPDLDPLDLDAPDLDPPDLVMTPMDMAAPPDMPADMAPDMGPAPRCAPLPASCAGLDPGATEHRLATLSTGCAFAMSRSSATSIAQARAQADQIAGAGRGVVALNRVDLNRDAQRGVTAQTADRLKNHDYFGFRWNAGDMATTDWYPQAITGHSDAQASGGTRRLLVAWYDHREGATPVKGVRVSLVDLSNTGAIRYRHILLVEPRAAGAGATFGPVVTGSGGSLHAGGMAWVGDLLYVADTTQGLRVFDMSRIIEVTHTDDNNRVGVSTGRVDAFGYRYILPQIARYRLATGSCPVRFSFAGLDRSAAAPTLLTGEYRADDAGGRLVQWPVDGQTGWLAAEPSGLVHATRAFVGAQTRMQGALTWSGGVYMSSSSQYMSFGRLYRTRPGQQTSSVTAWVYGAEDLYLERSTDRIWTPAEHPNARDVVSIPRQNP